MKKLSFALFDSAFLFLILSLVNPLANAQPNDTGALKVNPEVRTTDGKKPFVENEILVKFKHGIDSDKARGIANRHGTSILSRSPRSGVYRLRVPRGRTVEETVSEYQSDADVEYAEPNYTVQALLIPNDTFYSYQWHFDDTLPGGNPFGGDSGGGISLEPAWDITAGSNP